MNLRNKLFLSFFALTGLALVIFATIAINDSSKILQDEIESSLNSIVEQKVSAIDNFFNVKRSAIKLYSNLPVVKRAMNELKPAFYQGIESIEYQAKNREYQSFFKLLKNESSSYDIFLIAPNGDIVLTILHESDFGTNLKNGQYSETQLALAYKLAKENQNIATSKFDVYEPSSKMARMKGAVNKTDNSQENYSAFIAAPILDKGRLIGVIAIQIDSQEYYHLSTDYVGLGQSGETVIGHLSKDGSGEFVEIIAPLRTNTSSAFQLKYEIGSEFAIPLQKAVKGESSSGKMKDYQGKSIIAAWRYVKSIGWGIVVKIDSEEALQRTLLLRNKFINAGLALMLGAALLAFFLSNKITKPIGRLLDFTLALSSGEFNKQLEVKSNDEIGRLTRAFNQMALARANYEKELEVTSQTVIKANKELIDANQAAQEAVRAKGEFFASMSHEIRTPMNGVLGMLGLLENTDLNKQQQHRINVAKTSAESLLILINDILDYSKVDAGKLELEYLNFDLRKMIGDMAESLAHLAQSKEIELILDLRGVEASMVKGDPGRIRQCITNLVSNAIKFTEKGQVVIQVHLTSINNHTWRMNCAVNDSGIGIPEEKLKFLFDSFSQVDASTTRRFGGTGLGLAIVKKLSELMGGSVFVTSEIGVGSSFSFDIELEKSKKSKIVMPHFDISKLSILVVDDNETNREIFKEQLTHWGAEVYECQSAKEALSHLDTYIQEKKPMYDIAILDMQMPNMDGAELGKKIRANKSLDDLKLVMMTSMSHQGDAKFFAELGFSAYFPKPTTTDDLFHALSVVAEDGDAMTNAEPLVTHRYLNELQAIPDQNETKKAEINFSKKRILLVEDNQVNQMVAKGILKKIGCTNIDVAANGNEALNSLQQTPEDAPYDIVLMDCQMPELDGYEATKRIRKERAGVRNKAVPIIAMTANAMIGDKEKCLDAGMNDYLTKPIDFGKLKEKLIQWLS